jgi:hypothetical protein
MDYRSISALALRLAGVFILVSGIAGMPNTFVNLYVFAAREALSPSVLPVLLQTFIAASGALIIGLLLVFFPSVVANRVVNAEAVGKEGSLGYRELQALGFSVLGLYFVAIGFFDGIYWFARARIYYQVISEASAAFPRPPALAPDEFGGAVSSALQFLGGLGLLLGARGLSRLVQKLRGADDVDR